MSGFAVNMGRIGFAKELGATPIAVTPPAVSTAAFEASMTDAAVLPGKMVPVESGSAVELDAAALSPDVIAALMALAAPPAAPAPVPIAPLPGAGGLLRQDDAEDGKDLPACSRRTDAALWPVSSALPRRAEDGPWFDAGAVAVETAEARGPARRVAAFVTDRLGRFSPARICASGEGDKAKAAPVRQQARVAGVADPTMLAASLLVAPPVMSEEAAPLEGGTGPEVGGARATGTRPSPSGEELGVVALRLAETAGPDDGSRPNPSPGGEGLPRPPSPAARGLKAGEPSGEILPKPLAATEAPTLQPAASAPQIAPVTIAALIPAASDDRDAPEVDPALLAPVAVTAQPAPLARAEAPAAQAPVDTNGDWIAAMIDRISDLRDGAGSIRETRIRLLPDALGAIDIAIRKGKAGLSLSFTADNDHARRLLAEHAPRLAEIAEQRGLRLAEARIETGDAGMQAGDERRRPPLPSPVPEVRRDVDAPVGDLPELPPPALRDTRGWLA